MVNYKPVIAQLDTQIAQLTQARDALVGLNGGSSKPGVQRHVSPEGRRRMQLAQRKRWAKWKKEKKQQ